MLSGKPLFYSISVKAIVAVSIIVVLASCTIVKKYQPGKPFVYKTNINLIGNFSNDEKDVLISGLEGQLDDSLQVRKLDKLLWSVMKNPSLYDSTSADKSIIFMQALLRSMGYFSDSIYYDGHVKTWKQPFIGSIFKKKPDQLRTTVIFNVKPGKQVHLDSLKYNLRHAELQH